MPKSTSETGLFYPRYRKSDEPRYWLENRIKRAIARNNREAIQVGDQVRLLVGYHGYTYEHLEGSLSVVSGAVGTVGAVRVPYVSGDYKYRNDLDEFLCIDFVIDDQRIRVRPSYGHVRKI